MNWIKVDKQWYVDVISALQECFNHDFVDGCQECALGKSEAFLKLKRLVVGKELDL